MSRFWNVALLVALCAGALVVGLLLSAVSRADGADVPGFVAPAVVGSAAAAAAPTAATPTAPATPAGAPTASPRPTAAPAAQATQAPAPAAALVPAAAPAPTAALYADYTVQRGDILYTIAARHGVKVADIVAINQIPNPDQLTVGQVIRIPVQR